MITTIIGLLSMGRVVSGYGLPDTKINMDIAGYTSIATIAIANSMAIDTLNINANI